MYFPSYLQEILDGEIKDYLLCSKNDINASVAVNSLSTHLNIVLRSQLCSKGDKPARYAARDAAVLSHVPDQLADSTRCTPPHAATCSVMFYVKSSNKTIYYFNNNQNSLF